MKSSAKHVLFCRTVADRKTHLYPVSVHANDASAKQYAVMCHMAHASGNVKLLKELDPGYPFAEGEKVNPDTKWSITVVQYEPTVELPNVLTQATPEPSKA